MDKKLELNGKINKSKEMLSFKIKMESIMALHNHKVF